MLTFMEWLASENATIAQVLKNNKDPKLQVVRNIASRTAMSYDQFKKLGNGGEFLVNFLVKTTLDELNRIARSGSYTDSSLESAATRITGQTMRNLGDFIFATWQHTKSKINNPNYTVQQLKAESDKWHEDIAAKKAEMPSDEYTNFIELKGQWQGWKWVSLGRGSCSQEAKAMGHCGNSGASEGDDILSLRDPEGKAHLTFIVNDGILGEMKGRGNSKPSSRYHQAILELLKHPSIHVVKGGGYAPERNFSLNDLPENERKQILSLKPNIDNIARYRLEKGDKAGIAWDLGLDDKDISLEGDTVTLAKYETEDLSRIVSGNSLEFWFGDDSTRYDNGHGHDMSWRDMDHYADKELEELMVKVAKDEEGEAEDAAEAWEESDTVRSAIADAYNHAYLMGSEKEALESLNRTLEYQNKDGFWVDTTQYPYRLMIHTKDLSDFMKDMSSDGGSIDLEEYLLERNSFNFEEPNSGFYGFDREEFLNNAKEELRSRIGETA